MQYSQFLLRCCNLNNLTLCNIHIEQSIFWFVENVKNFVLKVISLTIALVYLIFIPVCTSLFASQAGASSVIAVEASEKMAAVATQVLSLLVLYPTDPLFPDMVL